MKVSLKIGDILMKKIIIALLCCAMLMLTISCCKNDNINLKTANTVKDTTSENIQQYENINNKVYNANISSSQNKSISKILNNILQQQYKWSDFKVIYPKYEITAQSSIAINVTIPEFENIVFTFSGNLSDNISEYKMASVNAPGDILLLEHFGKAFDQILLEEAAHASCIPADELMQHLYKYEYIYIYRDDFYYYIRGYRHLNELTSEHIAMFCYSESHKRSW